MGREGHWHHGPWPAGRHRSPGPGLAVVIALAQAVGTTLAARDQPAELDLPGYLLLVAGGLALAARRPYPVVTMAVVTTATVAYTVLDYPSGPTFVALIIAGVSAVKSGYRYPVWGIVAAGYAAWVALVEPTLRQAAVLAAWGVGLLLVAQLARVQSLQRAQLAEVHREQAQARAEQQRRQASEQRLRMAQELHDVLGHHLSVINVQAGVGLHLMDTQPEQARAALSAIKQASAEALGEVRSVLAGLQPAGAAAPRAPAPGLDRVDELTDPAAAGIPIDTSVLGAPRPLPGELERAAYRIVQEALTNVRRHAPGAAATVTLEYQEDALVVQVDNDSDGAGEPVPGELVAGGGISGMRERAAALGGALTVGPRPAGGFRVRAELPLRREEASRGDPSREEASRGDPSREDASRGEPSCGEAA